MGRAGSVRYCCGSSRKRDTGQGSQSQSRLKKGRIFTRSCFGSWGRGVGGAFQFRNRAQERELLGGAALQRCGSVRGLFHHCLHLREEKSASVRPNVGTVGG